MTDIDFGEEEKPAAVEAPEEELLIFMPVVRTFSDYPLCTDQASNYRTMVGNGKKTQTKYPSNHSLSHVRGSERSERVSERVSAAEGASEASSPEQANE